MFYYPSFNPYNRQYPRYNYSYPNRYKRPVSIDTQSQIYIDNKVKAEEKKQEQEKQENRNFDSSDDNIDFFEIFGLKLYFDDILIICLLFFLYNEGVQDQGLFISLILLLLS